MAYTVSISNGFIQIMLSKDGLFRSRVEQQLVKIAPEVLTEGGKSITSLTRALQVATAVCAGHGFATNDIVEIAGADDNGYNGNFKVTVVDANTFTFTVSGSPVTPALGKSIIANKGWHSLRANYAKLVQQNPAGEAAKAALFLAQAINVTSASNTFDDAGVRCDVSDAALYSQITSDWNKLAGINTGS